jgi:hypothetical protein
MKHRLLFLILCFANPIFANTVSRAPVVPDFTQRLKSADSLMVWEGLPHPVFDKITFYEESQSPNQTIDGEYFYKVALEITTDDQAALNRAFRSRGLAVPLAGEKFCGGFHADYAVEWREGKQTIGTVLVCFTCHEIRVIFGKEVTRADLTKEGFESLRAILKKYRQSRPISSGGKPKTLKPELAPFVPPAINLNPK